MVKHAVDRLMVQLIVRRDRNKAHVLAFDGFGDGFRIDKVVLVGLHKLSRNQPYFVALLLQGSTGKVRSGTSFQADQGSLQVRRKCQQLALRKLLLQKHLAGCREKR